MSFCFERKRKGEGKEGGRRVAGRPHGSLTSFLPRARHAKKKRKSAKFIVKKEPPTLPAFSTNLDEWGKGGRR